MAEAYGYAVARLRARRGFFPTLGDYEGLLKVATPKELIHALSKLPIYGRYFEGLEEAELDGVERRLREAQLKILSDLKDMVRGPSASFFDFVLRKLELEALKTVVRAKVQELPLAEALRFTVPVGRLSPGRIEEMLRVKDLPRMIGLVGDVELERRLLVALERYERLKSPLPLEAAIDQQAYSYLLKGVKGLRKLDDRRWIREFIGTEVDLKNVLFLMRSYTLKVSPEDFEEYIMLPHFYRVSRELLVNLLASPSVEMVIRTLASQTPYSAPLLKAGPDLTSLEREVNRFMVSRYQRVFLHSPFHVGFVYAFLHLLFTGLRNLQVMVVGKREGLPSEIIAKALIPIR
jgi:vacuolar-type H+-ATPase subunit C/Vma6